jgi:hypothetical protein
VPESPPSVKTVNGVALLAALKKGRAVDSCIAEHLEAALIGADLETCDDINRRLWQSYAAGEITDADASAVSEAVASRRKAIAAGRSAWPPTPPKPPTRQRREPVPTERATAPRKFNFGNARPLPLDRNAKVRIMVLARALSRRTEPGRHYGELTAKTLAVLQALLWQFHNARDGRCFPAYETIAAAAGCARSTVAAAIKALEATGILSWVNRVVRVRERCRDLFGNDGIRVRVVRTSNAYCFNDPVSKSEIQTETKNQVLILGRESPSQTSKRAIERSKGRDRALSYANSA